MNPHDKNRRSGITGVWVALMGMIMVGFLGLAIDTTYVGRTIQELQIAADSASLAGAGKVKANIADARTHAKLLADANTAGMTDGVRDHVILGMNTENHAEGDIVTGRWYRWDDNIVVPPHPAGYFDIEAVVGINAVKVVARRITDEDIPEKSPLPLLFGPIFGWDTVDLEVDATAMVVGSTGAGILVLCDNCPCALKFGGDIEMIVTTAPGYNGDHSIIVNSDASGCTPKKAAVCGSGGALKVYAPEINIHAEGSEAACFKGGPIVPPLNPGSPRVPDPLADLPEPSIEDAEDLGCIGSPGCGTTQTCAGGDDDGYHCSDSNSCVGDGVCGETAALCVGGDNAGQVCSGNDDCPSGSCLTTIQVRSGYYSGGFRMNSSNLNLVLDSGVYSLDNADNGSPSGLVINGGNLDATSGVMLHIVGNGVLDLAGSGLIQINAISEPGHLYEGVSIFQSRTNFADASIHGTNSMYLGGTYYFPENHVDLGGTGIAVGNQLIANTLYIHGNGAFTINYDGRNPPPGYVAFLVE